MTRKFQLFVAGFIVIGVVGNLLWFLSRRHSISFDLVGATTKDTPEVADSDTTAPHPRAHHPSSVVVDIVSVGSLRRPEYQLAQKETFGQHPSVRNFFQITEKDDVDQGEKSCQENLSWRDVQAISGFCGGLRRHVQHKHRLLYELKNKFANPAWLQRTKNDPVAWLCAQKRPYAGFWKAVDTYRKDSKQELPDYLIIMDDDTYYDMERVTERLLALRREQYQLHEDDSFVVAGCVIRGRLKHFKWTFPFGGWGTVFSRGALASILQPLHCDEIGKNTSKSLGAESSGSLSDFSSFSAKYCPKLLKDRLGEYQVYREGMSLGDIMYAYVMREPYVDYSNWSLGFCLHSDWVWGYMVNYYNISIALGRRSKDIPVDRLGAYNGSEINPPYSEAVLLLRRQCDFDSDQNCTKESHMCHYITPQHMKYLSSSPEKPSG